MGKIIFITGGVRSGKSAFAEKYAIQHYEKIHQGSLVYLASGVAFDEEMADRIKRHQQDRVNSTYQWITIEMLDEFQTEAMQFTKQHIVLWDCITTWLNNVLFKTEQLESQERLEKIIMYIEEMKTYLRKWKDNQVIVILVSNEVLDELSSRYSEVNLYRKLLGQLHQWIVSICDEAFEMDYSMIRRWK